MILEERQETFKRTMVGAAFTAWQLRDTDKSFDDYLRVFNLAEPHSTITPVARRKLAERNIGIAERIRMASKKKREKQ